MSDLYFQVVAGASATALAAIAIICVLVYREWNPTPGIAGGTASVPMEPGNAASDIVAAQYVSMPLFSPRQDANRPWTIEYIEARRVDGHRVIGGTRNFETAEMAARWATTIEAQHRSEAKLF